MADALAELFERRDFKRMFKGPEAQDSILRGKKVLPADRCPALLVLLGPQAGGLRMGADVTGVLEYTCGHPA